MRISRSAVLICGAVVLLCIGGLLGWLGETENSPAPPPSASTTPETNAESQPFEEASVLVRGADSSIALKSATEVRGIATFVVDGLRYQLTAPEGTILKNAMDRLQLESGFTYEYKNYAGLGAFVTTINNRAGSSDLVWILYVNGEKSSTGISSTRIRLGDVIEWKLEESY